MPAAAATGIRPPTTLVGMPAHITASSALDLLSFVPELVGFPPENSLVLVTFSGKTCSGTLRANLPDSGDGSRRQGILTRYVASLVDLVGRIKGIDTVVPVVFTAASCCTGTPHARLLARLETALADQGYDVHEFYVAADGWGRPGEQPRPRDELDSACQLRRLDPDALPVLGAPAEAARLPAADPDLLRRTAQAIDALEAAARAPEPLWFASYSANWSPDEIGPTAAALTARLLAVPWARDVLLITWTWGAAAGRRAVRFQDRYVEGERVDDEQIALALVGRGGMGRPGGDGILRAIEVLRAVAILLPEPERCPCLAALAWLNWALGRSSVATEYVSAALTIDRAYSFAQLVNDILQRGTLPEWAFAGAGDRLARSSVDENGPEWSDGIPV